MKVLAFNSSPKMEKGNTALLLNPFLTGMREAGAEVELFYTQKLKINPCHGEFNCWWKNPGQCYQKDDMQELYPKLGAEVIVFASPLYVDGMSGSLKTLIDRMTPLSSPFIELREGHCRHPMREGQGNKDGQVVLVSNCGFWERDNFEPLVAHVKAICKNLDREFAGALLRPHGAVLRAMLKVGAPVNDILEAAAEAGRQLVEDGKISEETLSAIDRDLVPLDTYLQRRNQRIKHILEALDMTGLGVPPE